MAHKWRAGDIGQLNGDGNVFMVMRDDQTDVLYFSGNGNDNWDDMAFNMLSKAAATHDATYKFNLQDLMKRVFTDGT